MDRNKLIKFIQELRVMLRNTEVTDNNYVFDFAKAVEIYMFILLLEKILDNMEKFDYYCYLAGFTPDKIKSCINNSKVCIFTTENILRIMNIFNISFSQIKNEVIKNILLFKQ